MVMPDSNSNQEINAQIQQLQQQLQSVMYQKDAVSLHIHELESALKEVSLAGDLGDVYKAVGPILVKKDIAAIKKELEDEKETLELRIKSLENQEKLIRSRFAEIQKKQSLINP